MADQELAMHVFAELAEASHDRNQSESRDRFLLLAAIAATRAGCLDIAAQCRQFVIDQNSRHLISRFESVADALRDSDFAGFERSLNRFCSFEQAEMLAERHGINLTRTDKHSAVVNLLDRLRDS